ncbi:MAG: cell division protein FtsQ/DivIB, partial [Coriobacteriales bacterium]|nr:cell division protein FtsQ/DivIB [Coriobacteriales bacterium]
ALLRDFSPEMRAMVASISAPDAVKTTLTLYNNVGVAFGAAEDIEAKEQAIATLLAEHEGKVTYINVRVADRATYRAAE